MCYCIVNTSHCCLVNRSRSLVARPPPSWGTCCQTHPTQWPWSPSTQRERACVSLRMGRLVSHGHSTWLSSTDFAPFVLMLKNVLFSYVPILWLVESWLCLVFSKVSNQTFGQKCPYRETLSLRLITLNFGEWKLKSLNLIDATGGELISPVIDACLMSVVSCFFFFLFLHILLCALT